MKHKPDESVQRNGSTHTARRCLREKCRGIKFFKTGKAIERVDTAQLPQCTRSDTASQRDGSSYQLCLDASADLIWYNREDIQSRTFIHHRRRGLQREGFSRAQGSGDYRCKWQERTHSRLAGLCQVLDICELSQAGWRARRAHRRVTKCCGYSAKCLSGETATLI